MSSYFKIIYLNTFDIVPEGKFRDTKYATVLKRLKYLIYCLENLASRFGKKVGNKTIVQAPIHHHDIADMINTSRETTSREFVLLEKAGKVGYHNKQIVLFD